jgi:hypothetical protein
MDVGIIRRLAFIKYIFELGLTQSEQFEPANSVSILMFHDTVELFLQLSAEYLDVGKPKIEFLEYWDLISSKLSSSTLPQKESMRRLNKSRVALKHHGTLPSKLDIESFRGVTFDFLVDSTPIIFNVEFKDISLIDFVTEENARQNLHDATTLLTTGNLEDALRKVAIAFHLLIDDYETRKQSQYGQSPFHFGQDFTFLNRQLMSLGDFGSEQILSTRDFQRDLGEFVQKVVESLDAVQNAVRILAMGIDYPKYSKFLLITPYVGRVLSGEYYTTEIREKNSISLEDVQFCIDFVVDTALKLQDFDYTLRTA